MGTENFMPQQGIPYKREAGSFHFGEIGAACTTGTPCTTSPPHPSPTAYVTPSHTTCGRQGLGVVAVTPSSPWGHIPMHPSPGMRWGPH